MTDLQPPIIGCGSTGCSALFLHPEQTETRATPLRAPEVGKNTHALRQGSRKGHKIRSQLPHGKASTFTESPLTFARRYPMFCLFYCLFPFSLHQNPDGVPNVHQILACLPSPLLLLEDCCLALVCQPFLRVLHRLARFYIVKVVFPTISMIFLSCCGILRGDPTTLWNPTTFRNHTFLLFAKNSDQGGRSLRHAFLAQGNPPKPSKNGA